MQVCRWATCETICMHAGRAAGYLLHAAVQVQRGCKLSGVCAAAGPLLQLRKQPPAAHHHVPQHVAARTSYPEPWHRCAVLQTQRWRAAPDVGDNGQLGDGGVHRKQPLPERAYHEEALEGAVHVARVPQVVEPRGRAGALHSQGSTSVAIGRRPALPCNRMSLERIGERHMPVVYRPMDCCRGMRGTRNPSATGPYACSLQVRG